MKRLIIGTTIVFGIGLFVFVFPLVSAMSNERVAAHAVTRFDAAVLKITQDDKSALREGADSYNQSLPQNVGIIHEAGFTASVGTDPVYESLLCLTDDGIMATLSIPQIDLILPIYHYATDDQLEHGVGHIYGTSLPVGGNGTHCVLTGHRGLPTAELFTRLDELREGSRIYISSLNEILVYDVVNIMVVLPSSVEDMVISPDKDLLTLVTCTPYGVNTHRLIVTAERNLSLGGPIEEAKEEEKEAIKPMTSVVPKKERWRVPVVIILIGGWTWLVIYLRRRQRRQPGKVTEKDS